MSAEGDPTTNFTPGTPWSRGRDQILRLIADVATSTRNHVRSSTDQ
jgi:hypothetical protein